jgi:hypothetical protein
VVLPHSVSRLTLIQLVTIHIASPHSDPAHSLTQSTTTHLHHLDQIVTLTTHIASLRSKSKSPSHLILIQHTQSTTTHLHHLDQIVTLTTHIASPHSDPAHSLTQSTTTHLHHLDQLVTLTTHIASPHSDPAHSLTQSTTTHLHHLDQLVTTHYSYYLTSL